MNTNPAAFGIYGASGAAAPTQRGFSHSHGPVTMRGSTDPGNSGAILDIFYRPAGMAIPHAWSAAIAHRQEVLLPQGMVPNARSHFSLAIPPNSPAPVTGVASITREDVGGGDIRFVLRYSFNARIPVGGGYGPPAPFVGQAVLP